MHLSPELHQLSGSYNFTRRIRQCVVPTARGPSPHRWLEGKRVQQWYIDSILASFLVNREDNINRPDGSKLWGCIQAKKRLFSCHNRIWLSGKNTIFAVQMLFLILLSLYCHKFSRDTVSINYNCHTGVTVISHCAKSVTLLPLSLFLRSLSQICNRSTYIV